mmetsp:Transcript_16411/g.49558  ORF Transcript_16411/g.49558 Transcript_16411/m.49558 type:complete len:213 (+) Transcript_16411:821-1459(+)
MDLLKDCIIVLKLSIRLLSPASCTIRTMRISRTARRKDTLKLSVTPVNSGMLTTTSMTSRRCHDLSGPRRKSNPRPMKRITSSTRKQMKKASSKVNQSWPVPWPRKWLNSATVVMCAWTPMKMMLEMIRTPLTMSKYGLTTMRRRSARPPFFLRSRPWRRHDVGESGPATSSKGVFHFGHTQRAVCRGLPSLRTKAPRLERLLSCEGDLPDV